MIHGCEMAPKVMYRVRLSDRRDLQYKAKTLALTWVLEDQDWICGSFDLPLYRFQVSAWRHL